MYESISEQILAAKQNNQKLLLMGDFNCKIGGYIEGNTKEVSKSGPNFLHMLKSNKLFLLNGSEKCKGLWTRTEGDTKSILDYITVNQEDEGAVTEMLIDEGRKYAPARDEKNKDHVTSDHNTILATFNWFFDEVKLEEPKTVITKKGYGRIEAELKEKQISKIWLKDEPFEDLYMEWKQEIDSITEKHKTKVKKQNKRKVIKLLIKAKRNLRRESKKATKKERYGLVARLKTIDEEIKKEEQKQFGNKIDAVVKKLHTKNGVNVPNMWEIVKKIRRKKEEPQSAIRSKDGKVLEEPEQIKARYVEHFTHILKMKPAITEKQKKQEEMIELVFDRIVDIAKSKQTIFTTRKELYNAVNELKRNKCKDKTGWNNEMVLNTGEEMIDGLLSMINKMEEERISPQQWSEMKIKTIGKPGSVLEMDNKRGLFITDILSKIYEKIMKARNNEKISSYSSDFQMGGVKERCPGDCLLLLSETIRVKKKQGKKCYLVFGDAVKCFDKLWLKDALVELYKAGCEPQDIQMIYNMNRDTVIEIETPCGTTEKVKVGDIVKQGTVLGPTLCCVSIDQINNIGESQERNLGREVIAIVVFVDDVMSAGSADDGRKAIRNFKELEDLKKVTYGLKKTKYMVTNTGREEEEVITEEVGLGLVTKTKEYKYMGFHINEAANCLYQIEMKSSQNCGQIMALKSIASYNNVGPKFLLVRLQLYESCTLKSMLHGIEAWNHQTKRELKNLEKIQAKALCQILEVPISTPYMGILNELGIWKVEYRIDYRRIMFIQNILKSNQRRVTKRVVLDQKDSEEEDTIYQTTKKALVKYGINIDLIAEMKKSALKKAVKEAIKKQMEKDIKKAAEHMTKLRFINTQEFKRKGYINKLGGSACILALKTRLNMLPVFANYKGDVSMDKTCAHCKMEDDCTEHLVECRGIGETILKKDDINNDENPELWKLINERTQYNLKTRVKGKL